MKRTSICDQKMVLGQIYPTIQRDIGIQPRWMQRHAVAFTKGLPGGKKIRSIMHDMPTPEDFADAISEFLIGKIETA